MPKEIKAPKERIKVDFKLEDIPMIIDTMENLLQENKRLKEKIYKVIEIAKLYDSKLAEKIIEILIGEIYCVRKDYENIDEQIKAMLELIDD